MFNTRVMNRYFAPLLLVFSVALAHGTDEVRTTQEELRRRNIYFGDIDGRPSAELKEALRHYQKRKGLAATGQDDRETLRSLGVISRGANEPPPKELELPDEPVLKSDTKIDVVSEAHEIAAGSGVSVASVAPDAVGYGRPTRRMRAANAEDSAAPKMTSGSAKVTGARPSAEEIIQTPQDVQEYVQRYLAAVSHNRLEDELHFYADRVNYLGNGWVDRRIIEHSLRKYYARWPHRSYSRIEQVAYRAVPRQGEIVVSFRVGFSLRNGGAKARGKTDNEIIINAATSDPRIVSIKEHRVRP